MSLFDRVCEAALDNYGLVTASQAVAAGVRMKDVAEWVKSGRLEKCGRGVYRLVHCLPTEYDRYAEAVALVGPDSHVWGESVLAMHNLAMVNPARITVAAGRRCRRRLPDWVCVIRRPKDAVLDDYNGIPCENLAAAIRGARGTVMPHRLSQAVREAAVRGLLGVAEARALRKEFAR
ncbi:MAG: type IV toxin-antitoxin system AbiEi family antitoxin domain-containing protein [Kiritimatiellae bacterium]|nr:type IV toxin-antitoxin system AbiEi family antitoxin domain-containing protein [Kiritimatiellia bacterium]